MLSKLCGYTKITHFLTNQIQECSHVEFRCLSKFKLCVSVCLRCFTDSRRRLNIQTGSWRGWVRRCLCMPPSHPWPSPAAWCRQAQPPNQPAPLPPAQQPPTATTPPPPRSTTVQPTHTPLHPPLSFSARRAPHAPLWLSSNPVCPPALRPSRWSLLPVCKRGEGPVCFLIICRQSLINFKGGSKMNQKLFSVQRSEYL